MEGRYMPPELVAYAESLARELSTYEARYGVRPYAIRVPAGGVWPWLSEGDTFRVYCWWGTVTVEVVGPRT